MKTAPAVGTKVTVTEPHDAYYSGYCGNPVVVIQPGMVGIVKTNDTPYVRGREDTFCCVDFVIPDKFQGDPKHGNNTWRCGVHRSKLQAA